MADPPKDDDDADLGNVLGVAVAVLLLLAVCLANPRVSCTILSIPTPPAGVGHAP